MQAAPGKGSRNRPQGLLRLRYAIFGKYVPFFLFFLLAFANLYLLYFDVSGNRSILFVFNRLLNVAFSGAIAFLYVWRKPAKLGNHNPFVVALSFTASFVLLALRPLDLFLGLAPPGSGTGPTVFLADVFLTVGIGFTIYSLIYLRWNFSLTPEVRELVTTGPYSIVRHPVYAGEIVAAVSFWVSGGNLFNLGVWVLFVLAQFLRIRFEESLFAEGLPAYVEYAKRVRFRLIPGIL